MNLNCVGPLTCRLKKKYYSFVPSWLVRFVYREESAKGLIVKVNPWPPGPQILFPEAVTVNSSLVFQ